MSLVASKHADEIREMWQSRILAHTRGKMRKIVICALVKQYPGALLTLLKVTFPGFVDLSRPMFISYAHIDLGGRVVAKLLEKDGTIHEQPVFDNEQQFIYAMRKLADHLKLSDRDRTQMFTVLQKWVASDKRVGVMGEKLAS